MDLLRANCWPRPTACSLHHSAFEFWERESCVCSSSTWVNLSTRSIRCNQTKRYKRKGKTQEQNKNARPIDQIPNGSVALDTPSGIPPKDDGTEVSSFGEKEILTSVNTPPRNVVLRACTLTSGLIGALGIIIRQVSHAASGEGWPISDCATTITFSFESWHLEVIIGSVILVSSCRLLLLKIWPDFEKSSETANQQILTSLEPLDYLVVAFLPGFSEELLFRGALLPLFGINWTSIVAVSALFGMLHLGGGRRYSFAIWATCVGLVYGYATTLTSSITVPMASHALNNLIGGIFWRYQRKMRDSS